MHIKSSEMQDASPPKACPEHKMRIDYTMSVMKMSRVNMHYDRTHNVMTLWLQHILSMYSAHSQQAVHSHDTWGPCDTQPSHMARVFII